MQNNAATYPLLAVNIVVGMKSTFKISRQLTTCESPHTVPYFRAFRYSLFERVLFKVIEVRYEVAMYRSKKQHINSRTFSTSPRKLSLA